MASSGSLLLSAQEGGKIKSCQSEFIQFTFGVSTKRLENMQVTDLIPGFFDSFDISATSSMNSLTVNEDFAATSTPARKHSNKGAAGAKPQELHHEDEFPQGGYYGYGKHANGSEFSKEHIIHSDITQWGKNPIFVQRLDFDETLNFRAKTKLQNKVKYLNFRA